MLSVGYVLHFVDGLAGRVARVHERLEELHLDLGVAYLQLADGGEGELDVLALGNALVEQEEHVAHARLDVVARERRLVGDLRIVERMHGYVADDGILARVQVVRLRELLGDDEDRPLHHDELVVADVDLGLHERERAEAGYAHALGLHHELLDERGHLVPDLHHVGVLEAELALARHLHVARLLYQLIDRLVHYVTLLGGNSLLFLLLLMLLS